MQQQLQKLLPRHFAIIKMVLAGYDRKQICEATELSPWAVSAITRSPIFQAEIARRRRQDDHVALEVEREAEVGKVRSMKDQARQILEDASPEAATALRELVGSQNDGVRMQSAKTVLDRVFADEGPSKGGVNINISAEDANLLVVALKESNDAKGQRYDARCNGTLSEGAQDGTGEIREEGSEPTLDERHREADEEGERRVVDACTD
jgi:hypothetical protein